MSYRDDLEAAKERRNALARELRAVEHQMTELESLAQRRHQLERDLDKSAGDMDRARARVPLPMLANVRVASPCHASWDRMTGDDRARHCGQCDKTVFDLSAMTSQQAESLLQAHNASLCVRFYRRSDGTVMTSDCPVGQRKHRKRKISAIALATGLMAAAGLGYFLDSSSEPEPGYGVVMGEMVEPADIDRPIEPVMGKIAPDPYYDETITPDSTPEGNQSPTDHGPDNGGDNQ